MPLALTLIPMLPGLVQTVWQIIDAVRNDDATPAETKAKLDQISADLQAVVAQVKAVELPTTEP